MPYKKKMPPIWKRFGLRHLIGTVTWMMLFSAPSTNVVGVSAFSLVTQYLRRTKTSPIFIVQRLKNDRSFQTISRNFQLYERNKDDESDNMMGVDPIPSGTGGATDDPTNTLGTSTAPNGASVQIDYSKVEPQVVPQRWVQLAYLSLLALMSDWVCFSVAAAPSTFESNFGHSASSIIDIFLFTNVATSFLVTDIVSKFGLQRAIQGAAIFMTAGCWIRSGFGFVPNISFSNSVVETGNILVDYPWIVAGTVLVGIAQPFFQCTPPLLSAKWFANNERSTSTAIALNFNQIGIATAFLVGGGMATDTVGLENYFGVIACATTIVTIGTLLQFQNEPPFPPSSSELEKLIRGEEEPPFLESVQKFFATKGFSRALAAFICSISITNVVGVSSVLSFNAQLISVMIEFCNLCGA